jgi:hypothetical protein
MTLLISIDTLLTLTICSCVWLVVNTVKKWLGCWASIVVLRRVFILGRVSTWLKRLEFWLAERMLLVVTLQISLDHWISSLIVRWFIARCDILSCLRRMFLYQFLKWIFYFILTTWWLFTDMAVAITFWWGKFFPKNVYYCSYARLFI